VANVSYCYIVTAATKEEAIALLTEQLGPEWENDLPPHDIKHPQIEEDGMMSDIDCLGPVEE
jgi:hypothetical protein